MGLEKPPVSGFSILVWAMVFLSAAVILIALGLLVSFCALRFCFRCCCKTSDGYERALLNGEEEEEEEEAAVHNEGSVGERDIVA